MVAICMHVHFQAKKKHATSLANCPIPDWDKKILFHINSNEDSNGKAWLNSLPSLNTPLWWPTLHGTQMTSTPMKTAIERHSPSLCHHRTPHYDDQFCMALKWHQLQWRQQWKGIPQVFAFIEHLTMITNFAWPSNDLVNQGRCLVNQLVKYCISNAQKLKNI